MRCIQVSLELKTMHEDEQNSATSSVFSSAVCSRRTSALTTRPSSVYQMAPISDENGHLRLPQSVGSVLPPGTGSGAGATSLATTASTPSLRTKSLTFNERISETRPFRSNSTASSLVSAPPKSIPGNPDDDDYGTTNEINVVTEKRSQRYLITMVTLYAVCWFPINVLILATHFVYETDDNTGHFDISYLIFTFFGFLSVCVNPVLFASWRMSSTTRDRLRGYLRLSVRHRTEDASAAATGTASVGASRSPTTEFDAPLPSRQRPSFRTYSGTQIRFGIDQ